ncbi:hypothetical protein VPH35_031628 [Triticum aestivum]|uniref:mitochondrial metalloendopeptidase OMA1 n=1 Tax=Triticum aestivum TaxID=4565 RepID=UPI001D0079D9|nr:mitochondrial metalloendopeptidase OMA1-like [Triticum aestivum]
MNSCLSKGIMNSCLSSSCFLLPAALRVLRLNAGHGSEAMEAIRGRLVCQPSMSMVSRVSRDYSTSLQRPVTGHLALRGLHALWRATTSTMAPTFRGGTGITMHRAFHVETVPYTNRTRMVTCSPSEARELGESDFADFKKLHASKILDLHHHQSVRVHDICWKIIGAIHRGLSIKNKIEQRRQEPLQMMTPLDWIDELNWEVIVVEEKAWRGQCYFDGKIIVSTGLLDSSTDAEIAWVLGHEVGHVIARHFWETIMIFELWLPTRLLVTPLLRRSELEADYIGMLLAAAAGFDPHAAAICLDKAGKRKGESAFTNFLSFFSSKVHPSYKKRSRLLSQPKVMEEAMELYREATEGDGPDNGGCSPVN